MKLVREHIEFKQGGDPYKKLGVGKWANPSIIRELLNKSDNKSDNTRYKEDIYEWMTNNKLDIELGINSINDIDDILSFDFDSEYEELEDKYSAQLTKEHNTFMTNYYQKGGGGGGIVTHYYGKLKDGSKAIYYRGGMIDGYITRRDWLI